MLLQDNKLGVHLTFKRNKPAYKAYLAELHKSIKYNNGVFFKQTVRKWMLE